MEIKPALVKELRERTGAGMMECKKALVETQGDIDLAAEWLRKAGAAKADKKASRVAAEGRVVVRSDEQVGPPRRARGQLGDRLRRQRRQLPRVRRQAGGHRFDANARRASKRCCAASVDGRTVEDLRLELVTKVGENISVRRFDVVESSATVGSYLHGTRIGVLVEIEGGNATLARDLAMQVASLAPRYVSGDDVPKDIFDKEREIILAQTAEEKKPPEIIAKMVEGKVRKFVDEVTLTGQVFVKDDKKRVRDVLAANKAKVKSFRRYEVGEGIEKKSSDFVKEVMAQASQSR